MTDKRPDETATRPESITVTMRAGKVPDLPGSERRECEECGEPITVSAATLRSIARGQYPDYIICLTCANKSV